MKENEMLEPKQAPFFIAGVVFMAVAIMVAFFAVFLASNEATASVVGGLVLLTLLFASFAAFAFSMGRSMTPEGSEGEDGGE